MQKVSDLSHVDRVGKRGKTNGLEVGFRRDTVRRKQTWRTFHWEKKGDGKVGEEGMGTDVSKRLGIILERGFFLFKSLGQELVKRGVGVGNRKGFVNC